MCKMWWAEIISWTKPFSCMCCILTIFFHSILVCIIFCSKEQSMNCSKQHEKVFLIHGWIESLLQKYIISKFVESLENVSNYIKPYKAICFYPRTVSKKNIFCQIQRNSMQPVSWKGSYFIVCLKILSWCVTHISLQTFILTHEENLF